jgi:hypothetical protein
LRRGSAFSIGDGAQDEPEGTRTFLVAIIGAGVSGMMVPVIRTSNPWELNPIAFWRLRDSRQAFCLF